MVTKLQLIPYKALRSGPNGNETQTLLYHNAQLSDTSIINLGISLDTTKDLPELHWLIDSCVRADICVFTTAPGQVYYKLHIKIQSLRY